MQTRGWAFGQSGGQLPPGGRYFARQLKTTFNMSHHGVHVQTFEIKKTHGMLGRTTPLGILAAPCNLEESASHHLHTNAFYIWGTPSGGKKGVRSILFQMRQEQKHRRQETGDRRQETLVKR